MESIKKKEFYLKFSYAFIITILILLVNCYSTYGKKRSSRFILEVSYKQGKANDTLVLIIGNKYLKSFDPVIAFRIERAADKDGVYRFNVPVTENSGFWSLSVKALDELGSRGIRAITLPFFWEARDSIHLTVSNTKKFAGIYSSYKFTGFGAEKYLCRVAIDSLKKKPLTQIEKEEPDKIFLLPAKGRIKELFNYINTHSKNMSALSISVLKSEQVFDGGKGPLTYFSNLIEKKEGQISELDKKLLIQKCQYAFSARNMLPFDSVAIASNLKSLRFLATGLETESIILTGEIRPLWVYQKMKERFSGILKDELLAYFLSYERNDIHADSLYNDALSLVKFPYPKQQLLSIRRIYNKNHFRSYQLYDGNGKIFNLDKFKGKVVVIDFWFTGCGACSIFYENVLSKVEEHFINSSDVVFVSICLDIKKEKWLKSLAAEIYTSPKVVNLWTGGQGFRLPLLMENNIQACPTVLLVDQNNKLKYYNTEQLYRIETLILAIKNAK